MSDECVREMFKLVPEIDFNIGYRYYLYNIENYAKALLATLKSIKSKLPILRIMLETQEYEGLRTITQTLRKMMNTVGGEKISELSYKLETALLNEDDNLNDRILEYLLTLEDLSDRMEELVKKLGVGLAKSNNDQKSSKFNLNYARVREFNQFTENMLKENSM